MLSPVRPARGTAMESQFFLISTTADVGCAFHLEVRDQPPVLPLQSARICRAHPKQLVGDVAVSRPWTSLIRDGVMAFSLGLLKGPSPGTLESPAEHLPFLVQKVVQAQVTSRSETFSAAEKTFVAWTF